MKRIRFFEIYKELNEAGVIGTFGGTLLALIGFLMGLEKGFHNIIVCFQFSALIFCFSMFCLTLIWYIEND